MPRPILFLSDSVSCSSGLGRITRDLAQRVHDHCGDAFRVGTVGYGGPGSRKFPWTEYHLHRVDNWLTPELPEIAEDFAAGEDLILMCVWDASRLYWLGQPSLCPLTHLRKFAERRDIEKWIYGAIDAEGPLSKVPHSIANTYKGFQRVLDYSKFSTQVTGHKEFIPHGVSSSVFYPRDQYKARNILIQQGFTCLTRHSILIGCVATNQERKNWPLLMQTARILRDRGVNLTLWCHTDAVDRYWSIHNLVEDYGLVGRVAVTMGRLTDDAMAEMYSACNVTLAIAPEGFGYAPAESLACGVPVVAGSYGAQAEFIPDEFLVDPVAFSYAGAYCSKRPVYDPEQWADAVERIDEKYWNVERKSLLPPAFDWDGDSLWKRWEEWFRRGL